MLPAEKRVKKTSRSMFVLKEAAMYQEMFSDGTMSYEDLQKFAEGIEGQITVAAQRYEKHYKDDREVLLNHATHAKSIAAHIILLKGGYVPALNLVREDSFLYLEAIRIFAYLRAQQLALEGFMHDKE